MVLTDNSESVQYLGYDKKATEVTNAIINNPTLNDKFEVQAFSFGKALNTTDTLTYGEKQTNIAEAFSNLTELFKNEVAPVIFISDGNLRVENVFVPIVKLSLTKTRYFRWGFFLKKCLKLG